MDTTLSTDPGTPTAPLLLRVTEVARLLGFCRATIYTMIARGDIAAVKYGNVTRIPAAEIPRWIEAHTVERTATPQEDGVV